MIRTLLLFATLSLLSICRGQVIRIATYQYASNNRIGNLQPFANYLHDSLGYSVEVNSYPTVHALLQGIRSSEIDIAFLNTFGYLLLQATGTPYPMRPVAALQVPASAVDNYKSTLVARKQTGIQQLEDLPQKASTLRLALVNIGSTSGNLMPRMAIMKAGIDSVEAGFASVSYALSHANALHWLTENKADIAGMGFTEWQKLQQTDSLGVASLCNIWVSPEIPLGPVLFSNRFGTAIGGELLGALLTLHQKNPTALESIKAGWSEAKQATHFAAIQPNYYNLFMLSLGNEKNLESILTRFAF